MAKGFVLINVPGTPPAIGPYRQLAVNRRLGLGETSGIISDDRFGSITAQTRRIFEVARTMLAHVGATLADVYATRVYLTDMHDFNEMNKEYEDNIENEGPVRETVEVSALPNRSGVEIKFYFELPQANLPLRDVDQLVEQIERDSEKRTRELVASK